MSQILHVVDSKYSLLLKGFEARIIIIVPLYWGRYFELTFHFFRHLLIS